MIERHRVGEPILVDEYEAVRVCRAVAEKYGLLIGGSSGSVLAGVLKYAKKTPMEGQIVAIAADSGERYLETVYEDEWVAARFPNALVDSLAQDTLRQS